MIELRVSGVDQARAALAGFSDRRFKAAIATAVTRTARKAAQGWNQQLQTTIDRPTARTKSAATFQGATANKLSARVFVKDRMVGTAPDEYLQAQEWGGSRAVKKFEQALINSGAMPRGYVTVPGEAAQRDAYGNVSRSLIIAVLAQLGSDYSPGYQRVISKSATRRLATAARRGQRFVAVQPGARISPGIYQRMPDRSLRMVLAFKRDTSYSPRTKLTGSSSITDIHATFRREMGVAIDEHIARLATKK